MKTKVTIRCADAADTGAMQACAARAYAGVLDRLDGLPDVVGSIAEDVAAHTGIVAEADGALAGFVIVAAAEEAIRVINLASDPAHSGRGIARRLLEEATQMARRTGKTRLELTTHEGMHETHAFYRHLGWHETGRSGRAVFFATSA